MMQNNSYNNSTTTITPKNNTTFFPTLTTTTLQQFIQQEYILPTYLQAWDSTTLTYYKYTIFILLILISFCGNLLIIITILFTKRLKNATNYFLINMAVADLLVTLTCMPVHFIYWLIDHEVMLDPLTCKTGPFFQGTSMCCSIYTLTVIAMDRYKVILKPLSGRIHKNQSLLVICGIWCAAMLTVSPTLFVYRVGTVERGGWNLTVCDELGWTSDNARKYTYTYIVLTYVFPLVILFVIYIQIFVYLWFRQIPGFDHMPKCEQIRVRKKCLRRKRLIRMLVAVVVTFMLCHLPQTIINILWYSGEEMGWSAPDYMAIIGFHAEIILYINAAVNPFVYGFLHGRIKEHAHEIFCWIFCCKKNDDERVDQMISTRMSHLSTTRRIYKYSTVSTDQLSVSSPSRRTLRVTSSSERNSLVSNHEQIKELSSNSNEDTMESQP